MYSVSRAFLRALKYSRQLVVEADLLDGFATARKPFPSTVQFYGDSGGVVMRGLPVTGGTLTRSLRTSKYAQLTLQLAEPIEMPRADLYPDRLLGSTGPEGFEIAIRAGLVLPDGTKEMVPLGIFPIQSADVDGIYLNSTLTLGDRAERISDARFEVPTTITGSPSTMIYTLITSVLDSAQVEVFRAGSPGGTALATPMVFEERSDRWQAVQTIARGYGIICTFDGNGDAIVVVDPNLSVTDPVWEVSEGPGGALLRPSIRYDRADAVNRVIVTSANSALGTTYRGMAWDNDTSSPTWYYGRFGPKPKWLNSAAVNSDAQCQVAAEAILRGSLGVPFTMTLEAMPNPAIVPGDILAVRRDELNLVQWLRTDTVTLGLGPEDSSSFEVRALQNTAVTLS